MLNMLNVLWEIEGVENAKDLTYLMFPLFFVLAIFRKECLTFPVSGTLGSRNRGNIKCFFFVAECA